MLRNKFKSKKGAIELADSFYVVVYLFAAALFIFILFYAFQQMKTPMADALGNSTDFSDSGIDINSIYSQTTGGVSLFNTLFPFLLFGLIAMVVVSAFFIDSHPIFFFVSFIILGIVILISVVFSNIYQTITEDAAFGDTETNFSIMNLFMKKLPYIAAIIIFITVIILWGKSQGGSITGL
jgi:hypothetical protein